MSSSRATYYYAQGERIGLEPDSAHVAVQRPPASAPKRRAAPLPAAGRALGGDVWLHAAGEAPPTGQRLPVFRSGRTLVVALPEVRVEDEDPTALARALQWAQEAEGRAELLEARPGRLTLRAGPALDHDGVALARELVERCGVASASPRLLRVSPPPGVQPARG
jgi:hypothetical protein